MDMHFRVRRDVDIDHGFELRDVQPSRGDVRRDQNRAAAVGELNQHLVAFALFQFTMQGERDKACNTCTSARHCSRVLQKASVLTGR